MVSGTKKNRGTLRGKIDENKKRCGELYCEMRGMYQPGSVSFEYSPVGAVEVQGAAGGARARCKNEVVYCMYFV